MISNNYNIIFNGLSNITHNIDLPNEKFIVKNYRIDNIYNIKTIELIIGGILYESIDSYILSLLKKTNSRIIPFSLLQKGIPYLKHQSIQIHIILKKIDIIKISYDISYVSNLQEDIKTSYSKYELLNIDMLINIKLNKITYSLPKYIPLVSIIIKSNNIVKKVKLFVDDNVYSGIIKNNNNKYYLVKFDNGVIDLGKINKIIISFNDIEKKLEKLNVYYEINYIMRYYCGMAANMIEYF